MFLRKTLFVLTILGACMSVPSVPQVSIPEIAEVTYYHDPNPTSTLPKESLFMFVASENGMRGRAFIANNYIFSASHLYDKDYIELDHDVINLGPSPVEGGTVSLDPLKEDDFLFFWTIDRGLMPLRVIKVADTSYTVLCRPALGKIISGDSGTPVYNIRGEIIGLISAVWIGTDGAVGNVERILKEDLTYTAPSSNG
jgi:hypothetical protein